MVGTGKEQRRESMYVPMWLAGPGGGREPDPTPPCGGFDDHEEANAFESNLWSFVFMSIGVVAIAVTTPIWLLMMVWIKRQKWIAWTWARASECTQWDPSGALCAVFSFSMIKSSSVVTKRRILCRAWISTLRLHSVTYITGGILASLPQ